jgi:uncharacterized membrane protein
MKRIFEGLKDQNAAVIGALIGFFLGFFLILFGFWKTFFLIILTVAGYYIGKKYFSNKEDLKKLLDKIFPPGKFR